MKTCGFFVRQLRQRESYYLQNDGTTAASSHFYISEYFAVTAEETYTLSQIVSLADAASICFYDANKDLISCVNISKQLQQQIVVPSNAVCARSTEYKKSDYASKL